MQILEFNLLYTLIVALCVLFAGRELVGRVGFLARFSIPAPVVGGVVISVALALLDGFSGIRASFDMSLKDGFLLAFFTSIGLEADARMLLKGGRKLVIFLGAAILFIACQNVVGLIAAGVLDLHPAVGLIAGSITLTGGHGTGGAYATRFVETMNIRGSMELAMACATAGLVLGSLLGGPLAEFLIRRGRLSASPDAAVDARPEATVEAPEEGVSPQSFLNVLFVVFVCLAGGKLIAEKMAGSGLILPDFVFCLLLGVLIRNVLSLTGLHRIHEKSLQLLGNVSLSLFLVLALMAMKLLDLATLAGPLLVILGLQTAAMAAFAVFVTFPLLGRDYDAAVLAAGHVGFALSSTAAALAIMKAVTDRSGPSPVAFLLVPMVGAFFIDIANALVIQGFMALPGFGF